MMPKRSRAEFTPPSHATETSRIALAPGQPEATTEDKKRAEERSLADRFAQLDPDMLVNTRVVALVLGYTTTWVELMRTRGTGPPFVRLSPKRVRYRVQDVRDWLAARSGFTCTSQYRDAATTGK